MTKILAAFSLAMVLGATARYSPAADDPKLPDTKAFDKLVIDTLRDVHNKGADLYNASKDFVGAFRLYQGALVTVRPLLAHRPDAQKIIDTGLAAADKETDVSQKAFVLHVVIESVRKNLKVRIGESKPEDKKPDDTKKPDDVKKPDDKTAPARPTKKPDDKTMPADPPKKPDDKVALAPMPKEVKPKEVIPAGAATVSGKVTLAGKPMTDGEVKFVSLNQAKPKVITASIKADGTFQVAEAVPPGKYAGIVTGTGVPAKYTLANTSGLMFEFAAGANNTDLVLK